MTDHRDTERAQFDIFKSLDRNTPINMLNLVQFFETAEYPDGHELAGQNLTGAQAYKNYGVASGPVLKRVGGEIIWRGDYEVALIGDPSERWDAMFIARYPTAGAFLAMVTDPEYQKAVVHRQAAVRNSRLIRTKPLDVTDIFA
ncbi:DUF1330 domain-containing protein [Sulfitobacter sp. F26169L]|uniref:DUF1330 domain-containing protein n=1 Tax=Sulfitobacter sp. F26169L TaxID=2996015 RepID=UPI002260E89D|nr:DUF1330 domain-containing protein [Sulfitobacter sp. F26169L]MCX7567049.1 DUF1330 domain-containing protein [Sulfitobacter sp. F26169L]